jgi:CheY-like chemotaxis protein
MAVENTMGTDHPSDLILMDLMMPEMVNVFIKELNLRLKKIQKAALILLVQNNYKNWLMQ